MVIGNVHSAQVFKDATEDVERLGKAGGPPELSSVVGHLPLPLQPPNNLPKQPSHCPKS